MSSLYLFRYEAKQKELQDVVFPILQAAQQGGSAKPGSEGGGEGGEPIVEEVD